MNRKKEICNAFNASACNYEQVAEVQNEIGNRLFQRLEYLKIQPKNILDLGCGPGTFTAKLKDRYPKARVFGLDLALEMLKISKSKQGWMKKWSSISADMSQLPFIDEQFDLIFSNQVIHWAPIVDVLRELNRVLAKGGCLMFSTLGPDTFQELKCAFSAVDNFDHVNGFLDMHDIGDCMLRERFSDPVIDMEVLSVHYPSLKDLLYGLKSQGVINISPNRNKGLTGKNSWSKFQNEMLKYRTETDKYPLTYEVVNGHAWKGDDKKSEQSIEASFSVADLKATLKKKR
ncbi:MAG: malonyl-ACP O-methyltransferase BioC [Legionellaceae bacterium]|nr:malonyl-ACP O-methyltransferase BioC [Legionellaceae bacterium]